MATYSDSNVGNMIFNVLDSATYNGLVTNNQIDNNQLYLITDDETYVPKTAGVTAVSWDSSNKKITRTINGSSADVVQFAAGSNISLTGAANKLTIAATDTTYTAGAGLTLSGTQFKHSNSVTGATVSDGGSTRTLAFGGTFKIPSVTYDNQGHITSTSTITLTMPANPNTNTDTLVKQTAKSDNVNYKILMTTSASPTSGNAAEAAYDTDITINPSTNTITATNFAGNASTASAVAWSGVTGKPTTLSGYGITDAKIASGVITLGSNTITPLTSSSTLNAANLSGTVPTACLPSYVDDVLEYTNKASFPATGETAKIYVDKATNLTYRWSGSAYVEISPSLALGTTSSTAFRGDYGNSAYAHAVTNKGSAFSSGLYKITTNSEGHVTAATAVTKADITGLGIPGSDTNTTYSAGTGLSLSGTTFNHSNSVTAKTAYGSTATTASANGGTIKVTDVQYDAQGHITSSTDRTITLSQTTYTLSGLGGVGTVSASGTAPLTLSASKSGTTVTLTGSVSAASTSASGVVQLNSAVNSTATNQAATPSAVKSAYDLANTANTTANAHKYWANVEATSAAAYGKAPEMATIKLNGNTSASSASTKNVTLQYDSTLETLNFVFA